MEIKDLRVLERALKAYLDTQRVITPREQFNLQAPPQVAVGDTGAAAASHTSDQASTSVDPT